MYLRENGVLEGVCLLSSLWAKIEMVKNHYYKIREAYWAVKAYPHRIEMLEKKMAADGDDLNIALYMLSPDMQRMTAVKHVLEKYPQQHREILLKNIVDSIPMRQLVGGQKNRFFKLRTQFLLRVWKEL